MSIQFHAYICLPHSTSDKGNTYYPIFLLLQEVVTYYCPQLPSSCSMKQRMLSHLQNVKIHNLLNSYSFYSVAGSTPCEPLGTGFDCLLSLESFFFLTCFLIFFILSKKALSYQRIDRHSSIPQFLPQQKSQFA